MRPVWITCPSYPVNGLTHVFVRLSRTQAASESLSLSDPRPDAMLSAPHGPGIVGHATWCAVTKPAQQSSWLSSTHIVFLCTPVFVYYLSVVWIFLVFMSLWFCFGFFPQLSHSKLVLFYFLFILQFFNYLNCHNSPFTFFFLIKCFKVYEIF